MEWALMGSGGLALTLDLLSSAQSAVQTIASLIMTVLLLALILVFAIRTQLEHKQTS